jgi:hypothetical protein
VTPNVLGTFRREEKDKVEVVKDVVVIEEANKVDTRIVLVSITQSTMVELIMEVAINELTVMLDPTNVLNCPALNPTLFANRLLVVSVEFTVAVFVVMVEPIAVENASIFPLKLETESDENAPESAVKLGTTMEEATRVLMRA